MGWPLAVSAGLLEKRGSALLAALPPLAAGHFAAMALVLLPFALLAWLVDHSVALRIGGGLVVVAFGGWRLVDRRHPQALARIRPTQLAVWSFFIAIAHGAGLMLVPIYLGMNALQPPAGHAGMHHGDPGGIADVFLVSAVHTTAMIAGGGVVAWLVYRYLGLQFLRKSWFNLEAFWALSLIVAGAAGIWTAVA
jgi:hypothetical protein